ncbi:uncharacterized protein LOC136035554 isoform X2 [Artemia franciscana]|uniref:uncharacterized protein LOC136035554 isoform X2 n=1 Tax=Artemia franciscana TaxID=6661 RepID=UPI0032DBC1DB
MDSWPLLYYLWKWFFIEVLCFTGKNVFCETNQNYYISQLCKDPYLSTMYRKIDGAVVISRAERDINCVATFQTETVLQKFTLQFQHLQLDCNDRLLIYDGGHAIGTPKAELSCRHTHHNVPIMQTRTNYLTMKYNTDAWGSEANGFQLTITAFKDKADHLCKENDFKCSKRDFCISKDLLCDGVNHCGDNSDEYTMYCTDGDFSFIKLDQTVLIVIGATAGGVAVALGISVAICLCRRRPRTVLTRPGNLHSQVLPSLTNGNVPSQTDPLLIEKNQGNVKSPADVLLSLLHQANLFCLVG